MAPIRWQGGDKAPSMKSSLLCRLILNWPDPLTGTGTLKKRHIQVATAKTGPLNDYREVCFSKKHWTAKIFVRRAIKASLDVFVFNKNKSSITTLMSNYNYIQLIGTFQVLNRKGLWSVVIESDCYYIWLANQESKPDAGEFRLSSSPENGRLEVFKRNME